MIKLKNLKTDFLGFVVDELGDMVESHLENWMDRYYRKTVDDIVEDMALNYDFSADIESAEFSIGRKLDDDERDEFVRLFLERVRENFYL